ncbi:glycosyltransferase [Poriferisphaera sp. WC338]|uniref:glycosyltransferase n=1 Tax=Poriferisphaera sp. WC338 TaxID=3425129 RepID=UPI003D818F96
MNWMIYVYVVAMAGVCGLWTYFNFSRTYRSNLKHRLDPDKVGEWLNTSSSCPITSDVLVNKETAQCITQTKNNEHKKLGRLPGGMKLPGVAVLSPGRNEGNHIGKTMPALCEQKYDGQLRVVFIDDDSDDHTETVCAELIEEHKNLTILRNQGDLPRGWVGKCWALARGYEKLKEVETEASKRGIESAELICFTDADIHWKNQCLQGAVEHMMRNDADVVALFPTLKFGSTSEAIVQLQLMLALGVFYPFDKAMDPKHPDTLTTGAFILVKREWYDRIGGHNAVKGEVLDDIRLGITLKTAGAKVQIAMSGGLLWCRMYEGWWDMWEGLTKNAFAGLKYSYLRAIGLFGLTIFGTVLVPVYVIISLMLLSMNLGSWWAWCGSILASGAWLFQTRMMNAIRKMVTLNGWYALTMPIGCGIYLIILSASIWHNQFGGNIWKGRRYVRPAVS